MGQTSRRQFAATCVAAGVGAFLAPFVLHGASSGPGIAFPSDPRSRIAIATWSFRDVIAGTWQPAPNEAEKMDLKDFPAHVVEKFKVNKIEPWNFHFRSVEPKYLDELRAAVSKASAEIVNIVLSDWNSHYAVDRAVRDKAVAFGKQWIDIAVAAGCGSIRPNIPRAKDSAPNVGRSVDSLLRIVEYASAKNVVVNLENDDLVSEDALFLAEVVEKVNSPWLRALPDFGNSFLSGDPEHAYKGIDALFGRAYNICHVRELQNDESGKIFHADLARIFAILKRHDFKGYLSIEWASPGEVYAGTAELIEKTVRAL